MVATVAACSDRFALLMIAATCAALALPINRPTWPTIAAST